MATKLKNGKFRAQVFLGADENGKRLYKSFVADTADEADFEALSFKLGRGKSVDKKTVTLRAAMTAYIQSKEGVLAQSTVNSYYSSMNSFGDFLDTPLCNLNAVSVQKAISEYARRGNGGNGKAGKPISAKTVRNAYGLLTATLHQNDIWFHGISLPQKESVEYHTPLGSSLAAIFRVSEGTRLELPVLLASWCSLRRSEILGLQFGDVDFDKSLIHIRRAKVYIGAKQDIKKPKTKTSARMVFLPSYIAEKIKAIPHDKETDWIVPVSGLFISDGFRQLLIKNNLPPCRFHDLRHAFVSVLAENGVDGKYIQEMGGWSCENGVMNSVYKQTSFERKREAAKQAENVFLELMQHSAT